MSNFLSKRSFGVITLMIAFTISSVLGFQQNTKISPFQRSSTLCRSSENTAIKSTGVRLGSTSLFMGKMRNKQAELQRKMMLAKQQAAQKASENGDDSAKVRMTDEELKEANDRKRFDELLNSSSAMIGDKSSDSYLTQEQEEENIDAYRKGVDRFFEGDPAPSEAFEELVSIKSENAIGAATVKRLIPWLRNTNKDDYVVVVSDPREKSPEFQSTVRDLASELPKDIFSKILFINADTPAQNRRLLKKNGISDTNIRLFSDEKREWMQAYTALGENRWSMTLFVLADERVQKVVREYSQISASDVLMNAVKATNQRRL